MVSKLLRAEEIASLLGVSKSFVYKLIRERNLKSVHLGSSVRVREEDLEEFVVSSVDGRNSPPIAEEI
ncbi:MAG: helix-turn-helix domain-containing protein [Anaerolineaceae bacterium]|nr:helix-turn-helix domain-containing protein [Anaerolineaceae bacterium]